MRADSHHGPVGSLRAGGHGVGAGADAGGRGLSEPGFLEVLWKRELTWVDLPPSVWS